MCSGVAVVSLAKQGTDPPGGDGWKKSKFGMEGGTELSLCLILTS